MILISWFKSVKGLLLNCRWSHRQHGWEHTISSVGSGGSSTTRGDLANYLSATCGLSFSLSLFHKGSHWASGVTVKTLKWQERHEMKYFHELLSSNRQKNTQNQSWNVSVGRMPISLSHRIVVNKNLLKSLFIPAKHSLYYYYHHGHSLQTGFLVYVWGGFWLECLLCDKYQSNFWFII